MRRLEARDYPTEQAFGGHRGTVAPGSVSRGAYCRVIETSLSSPSPAPWYGLDIETDTTVDGLDPANSRILAIALTGAGVEIVLDGDEAALLADLDRALADLRPGVIVTWNGAAFDLPFIADRARLHGLDIGLRLRPDPSIPRRDPLPGHEGAYRGTWYSHRHIDGYQLFRADVGTDAGAGVQLPCGLKPLARFVGLPVVEVDREEMHLLDARTTRRYVTSDANLARELVLRRVATATAAIDRV